MDKENKQDEIDTIEQLTNNNGYFPHITDMINNHSRKQKFKERNRNNHKNGQSSHT